MDQESLICLKNELRILSIVDHPNIVRVYEYFETNDCIFIIMEVMVGGEVNNLIKKLFDRIVEKEHYSEREAANTLRPVFDAVRYCSNLKIAHRDLKVSINIIAARKLIIIFKRSKQCN